ncbi:alpha-galactosidase [Lacticaseibacillus rhamnosus]|nr:alpha-galactosidase [Lacticaseibacillus rhamnosus]MCT3179362.1 alpha-galactosidase [Lacticaseibacillus rhamnosus]MCT3184711.1 alpha-galactosidase [Lacticaseibacillus rhamnosus]MCT4450336.1 alpha-galactosidase [Lacticaseibacillus rhamnosus]PTM23996.1 alpha-galactosidase [Lacticaseibacillus rhamnosus]
MARTGPSRLRPLTLRSLSALAHAQHTITRSPAQKPAHKDLGRNDQSPVITSKATYAPVSKRAGSRSHFLEVINSRQIYVTM